MTSLMSNIATNAVLCPIVGSNGYCCWLESGSFVIVVRKLAWCAILLPSGSSACAMAHATSEQLLSDSLKFSVHLYSLQWLGQLSLYSCSSQTLVVFNTELLNI